MPFLAGISGGAGGLLNRNGGDATIVASTFFFNITGSQVGYGGGIANEATMVVRASLFHANRGRTSGGVIFDAGSLTVENSTFVESVSAIYGSAIAKESALVMVNNTVVGNLGGSEDSAPWTNQLADISNNVVAGNTAQAPNGSECVAEMGLGINSNDWIEDGSCDAMFSGDPMTLALGRNGGPTQTIALSSESGAIDAGDNAACPASDQRGVSRSDGACDLGAFEFVDVVFEQGFEGPAVD